MRTIVVGLSVYLTHDVEKPLNMITFSMVLLFDQLSSDPMSYWEEQKITIKALDINPNTYPNPN